MARTKAQTLANLERIGALEPVGARKRDAIIGGLSKKHREAISTAMIEKRLKDHALGKIELSATQIRSLEILLDRRKPKLAAIDMTSETKVSYADTLKTIAEQAGWATAAVQVMLEEERAPYAAPHTEESASDAMSGDVQVAD